MTMKNKYEKLHISALDSIHKFQNWILDNCEIYTSRDSVPLLDMERYVTYLESTIRDSQNINDRPKWIAALKTLQARITVMKNEGSK